MERKEDYVEDWITLFYLQWGAKKKKLENLCR
jgi:hypothetical protein